MSGAREKQDTELKKAREGKKFPRN